MLKWNWDDSCQCHRACDAVAIYVISRDPGSGYRIGFFPAPGPECEWKRGISSLEEAKTLAEACAAHVREMRRAMGYDAGSEDGGA